MKRQNQFWKGVLAGSACTVLMLCLLGGVIWTDIAHAKETEVILSVNANPADNLDVSAEGEFRPESRPYFLLLVGAGVVGSLVCLTKSREPDEEDWNQSDDIPEEQPEEEYPGIIKG